MRSEQPTPDELTAENELICEKLLQWRLLGRSGSSMTIWSLPNGRDGRQGTPSFTTWADAGLILDALTINRVVFDVYHHDEDFMCSFGGMPVTISSATTGPLAIRAAALEYIRSLP
jgi:hypothetical protein